MHMFDTSYLLSLLGYQFKSHIKKLDNNSIIYKSSPIPINMRSFGKDPKTNNIILICEVGHRFAESNNHLI